MPAKTPGLANLRVILLGLGAALPSCNAPPPTPASGAPADAKPADVKPADVKPTDPPPTDAKPADPPPPTDAATPTTPAPDPLALPPAAPPDALFQVAAWRDGDLALHRLGDDIFVAGGPGLAHLDARGRLVHLEYGLSGQESPGTLFERWSVTALGGRWPDDAWLVTEHNYSRATSPPLLHRRDGAVWRRVPNKDRLFDWYYSHFVTWREGQVLGLRAYTLDPDVSSGGEEPSPQLTRKIEAQRATLRLGFDVLGPTPTPAPMVVPKDLAPLTVAAAPTGELFMLAYRASDDRATAVHRVQRWGLDGPAATVGVLDTLPAAALCGYLAVRAADDAYVACSRGPEGARKPYLLRFDGTTWSEEPAPEGRWMSDVAFAPDGALWALTGAGVDAEDATSVWRRPARGAAWEVVPLPSLRFADRAFPEWTFGIEDQRQQLSPGSASDAERSFPVRARQLLVRAPDDVWIVGDTELTRNDVADLQTSRSVVLRSRPAAAPLRMLNDGELALEVLDWRPAPAWKPGEGCPSEGDDETSPAFVALRTLPRDAPRNQPEPALEAFLRDNQPVLTGLEGAYEVHRRGRRTVGLFIAPPDNAAADALIAAIQRAFPGERAVLECRKPRIRREFDRTTGRALQTPIP